MNHDSLLSLPPKVTSLALASGPLDLLAGGGVGGLSVWSLAPAAEHAARVAVVAETVDSARRRSSFYGNTPTPDPVTIPALAGQVSITL
jgi:hypothetical protein